VRRAETAFAAGKYTEAIATFSRVEKKLPIEAANHLMIAWAMQNASSDPATVLLSAQSLIKDQKEDLAVQLYTTFLKKFPQSPHVAEAKTRLGWCLYDGGDVAKIERAEQLWREVIAAGPLTGEWVGECQWHMVQLLSGPKNQWKQAAELCVQIARTFPKGSFRHEQALYSRAWLFWAKKDWPSGVAAFEALIAAYPAKAQHPPIVRYLEECRQGVTQ